jgi:phenylacetate-CoA ligase
MAPRDPTPPRLKSSIPGLAWPAVPSAAVARQLALLQQLEESQWWPAETLRAQQDRQLSVLLGYAAASVPFYRERLAGLGLRPGRSLAPEDWSRIPLLRREDIQQAGPALHSRALPASHRPLNKITTAGSTGKPVAVQTTRVTRLFWEAFTLRDHHWHRRDAGATLAAICSFPDGKAHYPDGLRGRRWMPVVGAVYHSGPAHGLAITTSAEHQAAWLRRRRPNYLIAYPSALAELIQYCGEQGVTFPDLREVCTVSEAVSPELRAACRETLGVPLTDTYSAQEIGYLALQCPDHPHYHVQGEGVRLEVLDEAGNPCAPGETGRVVVTSLHNLATPLIRYKIGDYAELGAPCPCGRGLPVLTRILGRVRNMVTLPNGERYWPSVYGGRYAQIAPVRQLQLVQKSLERVEVRLVVERALTAEEERQLRELVHTRIRYPFEIDFTYHDEIPRGPGGKYEDFKSEL